MVEIDTSRLTERLVFTQLFASWRAFLKVPGILIECLLMEFCLLGSIVLFNSYKILWKSIDTANIYTIIDHIIPFLAYNSQKIKFFLFPTHLWVVCVLIFGFYVRNYLPELFPFPEKKKLQINL